DGQRRAGAEHDARRPGRDGDGWKAEIWAINLMTTLQDQLDEITAQTRQLVKAERLAVGERAVEELFATRIEERILPVGAQAPEFALNDSKGRLVRNANSGAC